MGARVIVDPDFLDHWRTRMLVDELGGDEFAPHYLLRLWGHCQTRRSTAFEIPAAGLKGLCKASCGAEQLEAALIKCGYIERDGEAIRVLKWAEKNASLQAAWANGGKGGRPSGAKPKQNPGDSGGEPTGSPDETAGEPIREERRGNTSLRSVSPPPPPQEAAPLAPAPAPAKPAGKRKGKHAYTPEFEEAWAAYPARPGNSKADAFKAWGARIADGKTPAAMLSGVQAYAAYCAGTGKVGTEFVKQAATFFGPGLHFETAWPLPKPAPARPPIQGPTPMGPGGALITTRSDQAEITAEMLAAEAARPVAQPTREQREALMRARQQAARKVLA